MSETLEIYLNDHLGGAQVAIEILEAMRDQHEEQKYREFAGSLLPEIQADERLLQSIAEKIGLGPSIVKQAGGWLLEKAPRFKLGHTGSADFALFESFELLALGVLGKLCLWKALQAATKLDVRLRDYDFEELIRRAEQQYGTVERERVDLARTVLAPKG